jgi:hypothetical protein
LARSARNAARCSCPWTSPTAAIRTKCGMAAKPMKLPEVRIP